MSSKKKPAKKAVQDCLDRISASKRPTKKAVPAEEPSSDDDPQDRISPAPMPLKKRPAKNMEENSQSSDDASSLSSIPPNNLERETALSTQSKRKKRQRVTPLLLTEDQEEGLSDWLKSNDFIYMKGKREYKDSARKKTLWEGKALELGIEYKALMTWYESIRTRIGKLTSQPSGSSRTVMTDRDLFILRNFDFLKTQIARQPSRLAVSMKTKARATVSARESQQTAPPSDSGSDEIEEELPVPGTLQVEGPETRAQCPVQQPKKGKASRRQDQPKDAETVMASLTEQQVENTRLQTHIRSILSPTEVSAPQLWGSWIGTMAQSVHPTLMDRFYQESFQLVQRFTRETAQLLLPTEPQLQPLQPQQGELQTMDQFRQPTTDNTTQYPNKQTEYIQLQNKTMDQASNMTQRSQTSDPFIWNSPGPSAGMLEARPISASPNYDMIATGLAMSGLNNNLMDNPQCY